MNTGRPAAARLLEGLVIGTALVTMWLFVYLWRRAEGFFSMVDIGESHSIYATAWNIRDWVTLFLQDVATGPDAAAHPYWYIHHPNLFSRLFAFFGILLGAKLETLVLVSLGISAPTLVLIYRAMSRQFSPLVGAATACFVAVSYGIFYKTAGDLLRAFHPVMFWGAIYILACNPRFASKQANLALTLLSVVVALSDWGFFVFWVTFLTLWTLYRNGGRALVPLLKLVYAPAATSLLLYFLIVIHAVGWNFFLNDMLVTYFGKAGETLAFPGGNLSYDKFLDYYRDHNIVLWDMATRDVSVEQLYASYRSGMAIGSPMLAPVFLGTYVVTMAFVVFRIRAAKWVKLVTFLLPLGAGVGMFPDIAYGIAALILALHLPTLRTTEQGADAGAAQIWLNVFLDLTVWLTILILSLFSLGVVFPNYANWLFGALMPPMLWAEAGAFGLLCFLLLHFSATFRKSLERAPGKNEHGALLMAKSLWLSWRSLLSSKTARTYVVHPAKLIRSGYRRSKVARSIATFGILCAVLAAVGLQTTASHARYKKFPPLPPPYHSFLSQKQFRGKSVLATTYDAVAWYATKGWAYISTSNPPRFDQSQWRFRHVADWGNESKYLRPDIVLCDNSRYYSWVRPSFPGKQQSCITPGACDCRDVAALFLKQGHRVLASNPDFSVIEMSYAREEGASNGIAQ
jgi:hypothetical protein